MSARGLAALAMLLAGCYASHEVAGEAGPRPTLPGAYPIAFAPEPAGGSRLTLSDDQLSPPIPLGFSFRYFDRTYDTVVVSSNGFLAFGGGTSSGCCAGSTIPVPDGDDGIVAFAWTDLYPPGGGSLTFETRGSAPNRRFVLSATDQAWCCEDIPRVTAQVILFEGSDAIEMHVTRQAGGHTYTQGVEDESGRRAFFLPGRVARDYTLSRDAVLFITH